MRQLPHDRELGARCRKDLNRILVEEDPAHELLILLFNLIREISGQSIF